MKVSVHTIESHKYEYDAVAIMNGSWDMVFCVDFDESGDIVTTATLPYENVIKVEMDGVPTMHAGPEDIHLIYTADETALVMKEKVSWLSSYLER